MAVIANRANGTPERQFTAPKRPYVSACRRASHRPYNGHRLRCACSILALLLSSLLRLAAAEDSRWQLIWQDEFEGKALDLSKWEFEVNANGGGNHELQYYTTNNVQLK